MAHIPNRFMINMRNVSSSGGAIFTGPSNAGADETLCYTPMVRDCRIVSARVFVSSNARDQPLVITVRKNVGDTGITANVGSGATGVVALTGTGVTCSATDLISIGVTAAGSGTYKFVSTVEGFDLLA